MKEPASRGTPPRRLNPFNVMLGARIRVFRIHSRMSQTELGQQIGVSFSAVQKYEKGSGMPVSQLVKIAAALQLPASAFLDTDSSDNGKATSRADIKLVDRLLRAYGKIGDDSAREKIVSLMESVAAGNADV
jgi:transcriptional regulator with XRE-family HTH domain